MSRFSKTTRESPHSYIRKRCAVARATSLVITLWYENFWIIKKTEHLWRRVGAKKRYAYKVKIFLKVSLSTDPKCQHKSCSSCNELAKWPLEHVPKQYYDLVLLGTKFGYRIFGMSRKTLYMKTIQRTFFQKIFCSLVRLDVGL